MRILIILITAIFLYGCQSNYKLKVESNTNWTGWVVNKTFTGYGNTTFDLGNTKPQYQCFTFQKLTENGFIKLTLIEENDFWGNSDLASDWTDQPYGILSLCY
jgi:hypothetical protein